jgi:hypothetical protein
MPRIFSKVWFIVILLITVRLVVQFAYMDYYTTLYQRLVWSADDCTRSVTAWQMLHNFSPLPSDQFLPFHIYLLALGILATGFIYSGALATNFILGIIFIVVVYFISKRMFGKRVAFWSALLLSLETYPLWLTLCAGMADICFYTTILLGILLLDKARDNPRLLWLSAASFLAASATRYEAWAAVALFIVLIWLGDYRRKLPLLQMMGISLLALFFTLVWLGEPLITRGDYYYHLRPIAIGLRHDSASYLSDDFWQRLTLIPLKFWEDNPILAVLFLPALLWFIFRRRFTKSITVFLLFPAAILLFITYSVITSGGGHAPNRYAAEMVPFLIPFVLAFADDCGQKLKSWGVHPAGALLGISFTALFVHAFICNQVYSQGVGMDKNVIWAGARVGDVIESDALPPGTPVRFELCNAGFGIQMFSEHPEQLVAFDPENTPCELLLTEMRSQDKSAWVIFTPELAQQVEDAIAGDRLLFSTRLGGNDPQALLVTNDLRRYVKYEIKAYSPDDKSLQSAITLVNFFTPNKALLSNSDRTHKQEIDINDLSLTRILDFSGVDTNRIQVLRMSCYTGIREPRLIKKIDLSLAPPGAMYLPGKGSSWEERDDGGTVSFDIGKSKAAVACCGYTWEEIATYFQMPPSPWRMQFEFNERSHQGVYSASLVALEFWDLAYALSPLTKIIWQISDNAFNIGERQVLALEKNLIWMGISPGWRLLEVTPATLGMTDYAQVQRWIDAVALDITVFGGAPDEHEILEIGPTAFIQEQATGVSAPFAASYDIK